MVKKTMNIFKDMLTEKGKYSQGRVYLLWSVFAYYITLGILTVSGLKKSDIEMENFKIMRNVYENLKTILKRINFIFNYFKKIMKL